MLSHRIGGLFITDVDLSGRPLEARQQLNIGTYSFLSMPYE